MAKHVRHFTSRLQMWETGMSNRMFGQSVVVAIGLALLAATSAHGASAPPLAGCYERVYDKAHLAAHKGQLVVRARLVVGAGDLPSEPGKAKPMIAAATLTMWVRGAKQSFYSSGACWAESKGLLCNGSLSAAEMDECKTKADGVHDCRIYWPEAAGRFRISPRPSGVLVSIPDRLELPEVNSDSGPFLYLSHSNAEHHDFLLKSAPASACK
jgi:hypothetical protein